MKVTPMDMNLVCRQFHRLATSAEGAARGSQWAGSAQNRFASGTRGTDERNLQSKQDLLLQTCRDFLPVFEQSFDFPHLLVLVNAQGCVVQRWGDEGSIRKASRDGLYPGDSFALAERGVNAISAAMVLGRALFLERMDPRVHALRDWHAFIFPIRGQRGKADGYFGFLFADMPYGPGIAPFLRAIAMKMEQQYAELCKAAQSGKSVSLEERLSRYNLTARESQVASYWVLDYDYKQISKAIGISENTVRVLVGRINGKLNVNSKASMILRLFDAI